MPDDAKRSKALRTIHSLQALVDHPNTGDGERQAALGRIAVLREKHDIPEPKARTTGRNSQADPRTQRVPRDRTGGFNSTSATFDQAAWERFSHHYENINPNETETERTARLLRRQQRDYAEWVKANDEQLRRTRAQNAATAKAREESRLRAEAQERYKNRHANSDAYGQQRRPGEDPFDFANRMDGRTAQEKNQDMQNRNRNSRDRGHTSNPFRRCDTPKSFYDAGGEPRKRNDYPMTCFQCGSNLHRGEGSIEKVDGSWFASCCEMVPGPRAKKPGRG